ncbi:iron hydrogenase [Scleroderma yunnanense]
MAFSGALTLTDLNDFITPSQACIKPVETLNLPEDTKDLGAASTEIKVDSTGSYYEVSSSTDPTRNESSAKGAERKLQQAQISLNDCLACSGCITSAESVLITLQSHNEVLTSLDTNPPSSSPDHKVPVISIAPQSLASLAARVSSTSSTPMSLLQILRRVQAFCTGVLGFEHVYDTTFARHLALLDHTHEFLERKRGQGEGKLPMLASACPGWICYAEKTHAEMLPFIARGKSPQQVMGTLVKTWLGGKWGKRPDQIYHVAVMPCYDKKLEASRQDFYNDIYSTRDVDCVITTGELELLMSEKGWDLSIPVDGETCPTATSSPFSPEPTLPELVQHPGTSSGSYLHTIMSAIARVSPEPLETSVKMIRSTDYEEYVLRNQRTGEVVFRGAKCYGFRNLQNLVRKVGKETGVQVGRGAAGRAAAGVRMKSRKIGPGVDAEEKGYDYVEVMACPGGCINGGGQLRPIAQASQQREDEEGYPRNWNESGVEMGDGESGGATAGTKWGNKGWTKEVEKAYWHDLPTPPPSPKCEADPPGDALDQLVVRIKVETCLPNDSIGHSGWSSEMDAAAERRRQGLFRTQYRAIESEVIGLAVKW